MGEPVLLRIVLEEILFFADTDEEKTDYDLWYL